MLRLKEARKMARLTQKEVAQKLGITQNNYSYWEQGKVKISSEYLQQLSDIFGVTVDYLLGKGEEEYNHISTRFARHLEFIEFIQTEQPRFDYYRNLSAEEKDDFIFSCAKKSFDFVIFSFNKRYIARLIA